MRRLPRLLLPMLSSCLCGCAPALDDVAASQAAIKKGPVDATPGTVIVGASTDRRLIAYGTECDSSERSQLRIWDDRRGAIHPVFAPWPCMPGTIAFSSDGKLMSFAVGDGVARVYMLEERRVVAVSRAGQSAIGLEISPDSRWLVVASANEASQSAALDAWDADLVAPVEIDANAFFSPFASGPFANVRFDPSGEHLYYLGSFAGEFPPIATLTRYSHRTQVAEPLAPRVPATSWIVDAGFTRLAYVRDAASTTPPDVSPGNLVIRDLRAGNERLVAADVAALPVALAGDALYYVRGATASSASLVAYAIPTARNQVLDTGVFGGFGPGPGVLVAPGGERVAYIAALDPMRFVGELRVATLRECAGAAPAVPRVVEHEAMPFAFGWASDGDALAYLHHPTSTFPGAGTGTLSVFDPARGRRRRLGNEVTQINFKPDAATADLLFIANYDMNLAAGDLTAWNARSGELEKLGARAAVLSVQRSPDGHRVGWLEVVPDPSGTQAPSTNLEIAILRSGTPAATVAKDVTSLALADRRVTFTTAAGLQVR